MKFFLRLPLFFILYICFFNISYGQKSESEFAQKMRFLFESCPEDQKKFISYNLKFSGILDEIKSAKDKSIVSDKRNKSYEILEKSMTEFVKKVNEEGLKNWVGYAKESKGYLSISVFLNQNVKLSSSNRKKYFPQLFSVSPQNKNFKPEFAEKLKTFNLADGEIVKFSLNPLKLNYSLKLIDSQPKSMELKFIKKNDDNDPFINFYSILSSGTYWVLEDSNIKSIDKISPKSLPISNNKKK